MSFAKWRPSCLGLNVLNVHNGVALESIDRNFFFSVANSWNCNHVLGVLKLWKRSTCNVFTSKFTNEQCITETNLNDH